MTSIKPALFAALAACISTASSAQTKEWYLTTGGEWIFSSALLDVNGSDEGSIVRFSPFFNAQGMANYDFSDHFGIFTGLGIRNVGFIYDVPDTSLRFKFRTYNLGVPLGFKVGSMNGTLFFAGYEIELPINYKEKRFENEKKEDKFNVWFSDRNAPFYQAVMAGVQFKFGTGIKFKYYLTNFHNEDFEEEENGVTFKPYDGFKSNVIYVALSFAMFKNGELMMNEVEPQKTAWR